MLTYWAGNYVSKQGLPMAMPVETSLAAGEDSGDEQDEDEARRSSSSPDNDDAKTAAAAAFASPSQPASASSANSGQFRCPFCNKPYHARWMLERHLPSHTGQRPYKCLRCERRFSLQSSAVRHVKNVHKGEAGFDAEAEASSMVIKDACGIVGSVNTSVTAGESAASCQEASMTAMDAGDSRIVIG